MPWVREYDGEFCCNGVAADVSKDNLVIFLSIPGSALSESVACKDIGDDLTALLLCIEVKLLFSA